MPNTTPSDTLTVADLDRPLQAGDIVHIKEDTPIGRPQYNPHNEDIAYAITPDITTYPDTGNYQVSSERFVISQLTSNKDLTQSSILPGLPNHKAQDTAPLFKKVTTLPVLRRVLGHCHKNRPNELSEKFICISTTQIKGIIDAADPKEIELVR